nr:SDR family NAD(P)-dependent oxidoreductase [Bacteroidota bacterium]
MNIKGKVIWITGASSGMGEALALEANSLGAKVIISARNVKN